MRIKLAFIILGIFFLLAVGAEFFAPCDYTAEQQDMPYQPPTRIHFFDTNGHFYLQPFVYQYQIRQTAFHNRRYEEHSDVRYPVSLFVKTKQYLLWGVFPCSVRFCGVPAPAQLHLCGTDWRGRDLFARLLIGARITLSVAVLGGILTVGFGCLIGAASGYFAGWIDAVLMRCAEMCMMIPALYVLLAVRSALPPAIDSLTTFYLVIGILSLVGWPGCARIIRGQVLSLREREFVQASRMIGKGHWHIITQHILPHTTSYCIIAITACLPAYIVAESALSFLGLGIQEPYVSWGLLFKDALSFTQLQFHPWLLWPGVCISLVVYSFTILGDALRDMFDPQRETGI